MGSNSQDFSMQAQSRKVLQLEMCKIVFIELKWRMRKTKVCIDRVDSRPFFRCFQMSSLIGSFGELKPLHSWHHHFLGCYLELIAFRGFWRCSVRGSSSFHCFLIEVFTPWVDDDVSMYKVVELVSTIPTRRKSSNSESRVKRYTRFGIWGFVASPVFGVFRSCWTMMFLCRNW